MAENEKRLAPPYVPYSTFRNFVLEKLPSDGIPGRIDSSIFRTMSGALQGQLRSALRFLGLMDESGIPQNRLRALVNANEEQRREILIEIISDSYSSIFQISSDGLPDLTQESPSTFDAKFRDAGLSGDSVRKARSFLLQLLEEVGKDIPKYLTLPRTTNSGGSKTAGTRSTKTSTKPKSSSTTKKPNAPQQEQENREEHVPWSLQTKKALMDKLTDKYPDFDPSWDEETQKKWFEGWGKLVEFLSEEENEAD